VTNIKKIIFLVLVSFICFEKANTEIKDSLYMTVGNKPVTQSDIINEMKIILILNKQSYSDAKKDELHKSAVNSVITRLIKQIEIERHEFLDFSETDVQHELIRLATSMDVDLETFKNICASNELDFSLIRDQVEVELYWNTLIFELYKTDLSINPEEIEEKLKKIQNEKILEEYLISEILIKPVDKDGLESTIKEIKNKIENEGFENIAKNLSISESAAAGGELGWVSESEIAENIKSIIKNTPVGSISKAIILPEGILIFKIRDKRKVDKNLTLEERKNQLVNAKKTQILNMHSLSHYDKLKRSTSIQVMK
tara:strand:+ start:1803 stop:2741 length:939 start_codon:yes stop_codon:yes gene_type:complete